MDGSNTSRASAELEHGRGFAHIGIVFAFARNRADAAADGSAGGLGGSAVLNLRGRAAGFMLRRCGSSPLDAQADRATAADNSKTRGNTDSHKRLLKQG